MTAEVTLFLTSCGRPDLLRRTLESFLKFNTYPIKKGIIMEDCGTEGIDDFAYEIVPFPLEIIYNVPRVGQMKSLANGTPKIDTEWVFHCEEDWEFYKSGFIEASLPILKNNPNLTCVMLRAYNDTNGIGVETKDEGGFHYSCNKDAAGGLSFNPGLRHISISKLCVPYEDGKDEGTISIELKKKGRRMCYIAGESQGFVCHIGWGRHIKNFNE